MTNPDFEFRVAAEVSTVAEAIQSTLNTDGFLVSQLRTFTEWNGILCGKVTGNAAVLHRLHCAFDTAFKPHLHLSITSVENSTVVSGRFDISKIGKIFLWGYTTVTSVFAMLVVMLPGQPIGLGDWWKIALIVPAFVGSGFLFAILCWQLRRGDKAWLRDRLEQILSVA